VRLLEMASASDIGRMDLSACAFEAGSRVCVPGVRGVGHAPQANTSPGAGRSNHDGGLRALMRWWARNIKEAAQSEAWFVVVYDMSSPHRGPDGCPSVGARK
jgi:hypothetical protein